MADLSIIIPARCEEFLNRTVTDVIEHTSERTEVIVVLDGAWPVEPLTQHPRVQVVYVPEAIGQRAATNLGARISNATWICKLDAHCSVAPGFDVALLDAAAELGDDVTQIPMQDNLHVFDWVCDGCTRRTYQGPEPTACTACGGTAHRRDIVWQRRRGVRTTSWRFDQEQLKFAYWGDFASRPEAQGDFPETMSCLGACWFINRERFWRLGGLDEQHGSWGNMGTEVACLSWLSGGRMVCNRRTTFAHLFRTQGHGFGFPYPITGREQDAARKYSVDKWRSGGWPHQVRPLSWLVDHFAPVPGWPERPDTPSRRTAGVVYYSDNRPDPAILDACRRSIEASGLPIVAVTLQPIRWPAARNIVLPLERGYLTMFRQILAGLEGLDTDDVFFCEHDVAYHPSHFRYQPPTADHYYYNLNVFKVDAATGRAVHYRTKQTSGLCADRKLLIAHYRTRIARVESEGFSRRMGFEPGSHRRPERVDDVPSAEWWSEFPNIDIRHSANLTVSRWSQADFRDQRHCQGWTESDEVQGWGRTRGRMPEFLAELGAVYAAQ